MIILNPQVDREHTGSTLKCTAHNGAETVEQLERARAGVTLDVRCDGDDWSDFIGGGGDLDGDILERISWKGKEQGSNLMSGTMAMA